MNAEDHDASDARATAAPASGVLSLESDGFGEHWIARGGEYICDYDPQLLNPESLQELLPALAASPAQGSDVGLVEALSAAKAALLAFTRDATSQEQALMDREIARLAASRTGHRGAGS